MKSTAPVFICHMVKWAVSVMHGIVAYIVSHSLRELSPYRITVYHRRPSNDDVYLSPGDLERFTQIAF